VIAFHPVVALRSGGGCVASKNAPTGSRLIAGCRCWLTVFLWCCLVTALLGVVEQRFTRNYLAA
jgi:hypothetical protein